MPTDPSDWLIHREIGRALSLVGGELVKAMARFPKFNSPHEGWAVIKEELDELWRHVMDNSGRGAEAHMEAVQVAAMAIRYMLDLGEVDDAD